MTNDVAEIAAGLTSAQKRHLTRMAEWRDPTGIDGDRWMTFPPQNTHGVLKRLGLVDSCGIIRELGLAVRDHLERARHD